MSGKLLQKYLNGDCSTDEINELRQYFRENPSEIEPYFTEEEWEEFYKKSKDVVPEEKSEELFYNVESLIIADKKKKRSQYLVAGSIAASLLLFVGYNFFWEKAPLPNTTQSAITKNTLVTRNNFGKTNMMITLSDGSKVTLYPESQIQYDSVFESETNLYLTGKGRFDVVHNASRILKVWCKDVVTTDIGTVFLIDGRQDNVRIDLLEGKISVAKSNDIKSTVYLIPGQFALYNSKTEELAVSKTPKKESPQFAKNNYVDKKNNDASLIQFKNNNLKMALDQLSDKYGISIEYPTEKVSRIRMNMAIDTSQPVDAILKSIALIGDFQLAKESDKKYILK